MTIELHSGAKQDLTTAIKWLAKARKGLDKEFLDTLEAAKAKILASPAAWPQVEPGIRRYLIRRFHYSVLFVIESDKIVIIAVAHTSRQPGYWHSRIQH